MATLFGKYKIVMEARLTLNHGLPLPATPSQDIEQHIGKRVVLLRHLLGLDGFNLIQLLGAVLGLHILQMNGRHIGVKEKLLHGW